MVGYKVAKASEYLVITGLGVADVKLKKKAFVFPGQSCTVFDVSPVNYTFEVQAMSAEKLPFVLPAVFTIGPRVDDQESLMKYAKLISPHDKLSNHVTELVKGVIEGETRVLAASMTMEDIFKGTKSFKQEVFGKVQLELNQFGLLIYNANVKQLVDVPGHEYFSYLGQKTQQEAANQAKVDVSEARMKGEVGSKQRNGMTLQNAAKIDAETKIYSTQRQGEGKKEEARVKADVQIFENQREAEVAAANAELAMKKAGWAQQAQLAEVQAAKVVAIREAELQMEVERKNVVTRTEKLKAEHLSKANVEYEMKVRAAEGELYARQKEAEGLVALAEAKGVYIRKLMESLGGDYMALRDYMMIDAGMYRDVARINADAVRGLQPKISIWSNEGGSEAGGAMKEMAGVYKMLPPLFNTVQEQTGMTPPAWMGTLANAPANNQ